MSHADHQPFIDAAKERGAGDEFLASMLTRRGWPAGEVDNALADWWQRTTGVALPAQRSAAENARDAFLYLLAFSTLATWASALGSLWFHLIEYWLPDQVVRPYVFGLRSTVTWQMASMLVALPIYLFVMRLILRETRVNPERIESGVRKWLTYIALLLAATGVVGDLVCFVDFFLQGELTLRFVLKCATVFLICGSIFWYYLGFLRGRTRSRGFAGIALASVLTAFFFGTTVAGTPAMQRRIEADTRRVQDLRSIAATLTGIISLPASLADVSATHPGLQVTDPESGQPYEYIVVSAKQYELCATFSAADDARSRPYGSAFWSHPKGHACFSFDATHPAPW